MDPVVASKIHFTKNNEELAKYVPKNQLLKEFGGTSNYEWKYIEPVNGENDLMKDTETLTKLKSERQREVDSFEEATMEWVLKALLCGSSEHPEVTQDVVDAAANKRHRIAKGLRDSYWRMDPYIRARSIYDRLEVIPSGPSAGLRMRDPKTH